MARASEHLKRWREAGVIDAEAAGRIEAWEAERAGPGADDRPGVLEALLYLGVVVLSVGVYALVAQQWDELESWARVLATVAPVAILLVAGLAMRATGEPALERGGQVAWLVAVALLALALAVIVEEYGPEPPSGEAERNALLFIALGTFAMALVLWLARPTHSQVVALAGSLVFVAQAVGNWPDQFSEPLAGFVMFAFGMAGLAGAELLWLAPRPSARVVFAVLTIAGPYQAGFGGEREMFYELLTFVAAAGILALGVWRASFSLVVVAVIGLFVALVTFILEHFEDELGAPLALMLSGGALVGAVLTIAALRAQTRRRKAGSDSAAPHPGV